MSDLPIIWCVYVLHLSDGQLYVGMTCRLAARVAEHQAGLGPTTTRMRLPATLLWYEECSDAGTARRLERWLKRRSTAEKQTYMERNGVRVHRSE
jgi:putative endonuclease